LKGITNAMLLMLKNKAVYDVQGEKVINYDLLPGCMMKDSSKDTFKIWASLRRSVFDNVLSRELLSEGFRGYSREKIEIITRSFSLSDSYWLKGYNDNYTFENLSPYYNAFWQGGKEYKNGETVPTLFLNGAQSKKWISSKQMYKHGERMHVEVEASRIFKHFIDSADVVRHNEGILVDNFTTPEKMLEPYYISKYGNINDESFEKNEKIIELFGDKGFIMLLLDAIIGNKDRHSMNFGYLRDTSTGEYLNMAPQFDWDHAKSANTEFLIKNMADCYSILSDKQIQIADNIFKEMPEVTNDEFYLSRANELLNIFAGQSVKDVSE
jgi:hypothetical protein